MKELCDILENILERFEKGGEKEVKKYIVRVNERKRKEIILNIVACS